MALNIRSLSAPHLCVWHPASRAIPCVLTILGIKTAIMHGLVRPRDSIGQGDSQVLVLSRKIGEKILISDHVVVEILDIQGSKVKIGIQAPDYVQITRSELLPILRDDSRQNRLVGGLQPVG